MGNSHTKIIKLATVERIMLQQLLADVEGDFRTARKVLKLLDVLEFTPDEREQINLRQLGPNLEWDHPEIEWELAFKDPNELELLRSVFKNHVWRKVHPRLVAAIADRLGIPPEPEPVDPPDSLPENGLVQPSIS